MIIREAKESDVLRILEIFNEALIHSTSVYAYVPSSLDEQLEWYHHKIDEGYPVYVGVENELVIGYATYGSFRTRPAYKYTIEHSVYVDVQHRNKGYGKALLKFLIEKANESGFKTMVAGIDSANLASIQLHLECGFSYSGMIHNAGYKFGKWLDLAFYQLDLDGPINPSEDEKQ